MTREEAIGHLKHIIEVADHNECGIKEIDGIDEQALEMGINALEKVEKYEKAIKDIKAEIKKIQIQGYVDMNTCFIRDGQCVKNMVLEIIDMHIGGRE